MRTRPALAALLAAATLARAHGDHAEVEENPDATYAELHMAQEVRPLSRPLLSTVRAPADAPPAAPHGQLRHPGLLPPARPQPVRLSPRSLLTVRDDRSPLVAHARSDGVLDRNELESIYGVHHEKRRKGAKNLEVHTQQAVEIVDQVLDRLDTNRDGVLTMREFVAGGVGGLPNFKGVEHLGHHYGASAMIPLRVICGLTAD